MRAAISFCVAGAIFLFFLIFPRQAVSRESQSASATQQSQSNAKQAAATSGSSEQGNHPANLKKLAQEHKVITTDDLGALHSKEREQHSLAKSNGKALSDPASCDADCAAEARDQVGMGPDQEGEWQAQLSAALHFLSEDTAWRYAYMNGLRKAKMYCTFQEQLRKTPVPSGNDYRSGVERARREQYADDMDHTLSMGLQGARTQMDNLVTNAQKTDPVRAAVMGVLAERVFNQCADLSYDP